MSDLTATLDSDVMPEAQLEMLLEGTEGDKYCLRDTGEDLLGPAHTARRFKKNEPVKYATVLHALKNGAAVTTTARVHKISPNTVYAIIDAELGGRDNWHRSLVGKLEQVAYMGVERMTELLPECDDIKGAGIAVGIAVEKIALLRGLPTSIQEVRHTVDVDAMEEFNRRFQEMKQARGTVVAVEELAA